MIGSWSQYTGMVSNNITKIIKWIRIITNAVLPSGWGVGVFLKIDRSESRVVERRYVRNRNNMSGPSPPSNHSFLR